ncbi:PIG-L deacetylase family protein [Nonomuraea sp. SBT364]|uniref:PIG-L deacetylase family protein n=1 Tax=Nonomuraea sp. SBT364 TaxID=1580530 RepID=UPI00069E55BB|nr:PIG-L family deacetylase [Nonomuraea sp. SBT364]
MSFRTLVVSPHFDDAVLSTAGVLAALPRPAAIVTVHGGPPATDSGPSAWDRLCGFTSTDEAVRERRAEDARACTALGVAQIVLDHPDAPAGGTRLSGLDDCLATHAGPDTQVLLPMGIGNRAHLRVRDQALETLERAGGPAPWLYADLPYASVVREWGTGAASRALTEHPRAGAPLRTLESISPHREERLDAEAWGAKRRAILCYASQLAPLASEFGDILARPGPLNHELIWALHRARRHGHDG